MAHDVFISYSSKDKPTADAVCHALEADGVRCWIAPRDIAPGADWGEAILEGLTGAKVFVLVFSSNANASQQIKREVERAVNRGTPIIPFRIENVAPAASLEYFISTPHWLDAFSPPLEAHLDYLAGSVRHLLRGEEGPPRRLDPTPRPVITLKQMAFIGALALLALLFAFQALRPASPEGHWVSTKIALNAEALKVGFQVSPLEEILTAAMTGPKAKFDLWDDENGLYRLAFTTEDQGQVTADGRELTFTSDLGGKVSKVRYMALSQDNAESLGNIGAQAGDQGVVFDRSGGWQIIWVGKRSPGAEGSVPAAVAGEWRNTMIPSLGGPWMGRLTITPNGRYDLKFDKSESGQFEAAKGHWRRLPSTGAPPDEGGYKFKGRKLVTYTSRVGSVTYRKVGPYKASGG